MSTTASGRTRSRPPSLREQPADARAATITPTPISSAERPLISPMLPSGGLGVARHEERREHRDDEQVEQDRPADDEAGDVAERAPHDHAASRRPVAVAASA